nr:tyrosine-type recombinase/integrase [Chthoniobacterales bacterium]
MKEFVFRAKRQKNGKRHIAPTYTGRYRLAGDPTDTDVALGVSDKQVAQEMLRKIIVDAEREREGLIAPRNQRDAIALSLSTHAHTYCDSRRAIRCDQKYVLELGRKLDKLIRECGWVTARHVTPESFEAWRAKQKKAPKTLNEYLNAISGLMNWLEPRVGPNPLRFVQRAQTGVAAQRERRAFTTEELQRLFDVSGPRGVVYLMAARTGLRRGEMQQLRWADVHLDTPQPFVNVRASISKNHRQAQLPLSEDATAAVCRLRAAGGSAASLVFDRLMPRMNRFRVDLEAARIPYVNDRGEYADFHSLRKTCGTMLTLAGVSPRTAMEFMRHSDMRLTAKTYTDANLLPVSEAVAKLPLIKVRDADSPLDSPPVVVSRPNASAAVPVGSRKASFLTSFVQPLSRLQSASVTESRETGM